VLVPNAQGPRLATQFIMQEYLNLFDWKGLKLLSTERRCKVRVVKFERFPTVWAEWIELEETFSKLQAERGKETSHGESDEMKFKAERNCKSDASPVGFSQVLQNLGCR